MQRCSRRARRPRSLAETHRGPVHGLTRALSLWLSLCATACRSTVTAPASEVHASTPAMHTSPSTPDARAPERDTRASAAPSAPAREIYGVDVDTLRRPRDAERAYRAALAQHNAGHYEASRDAFDALVRAHPAWSAAKYNLACARVRLGDLEGAEPLLRAVLAEDLPEFLSRVGTDADLAALRASPRWALFSRSLEALRLAYNGALERTIPVLAVGADADEDARCRNPISLRVGGWSRETQRFLSSLAYVPQLTAVAFARDTQRALALRGCWEAPAGATLHFSDVHLELRGYLDWAHPALVSPAFHATETVFAGFDGDARAQLRWSDASDESTGGGGASGFEFAATLARDAPFRPHAPRPADDPTDALAAFAHEPAFRLSSLVTDATRPRADVPHIEGSALVFVDGTRTPLPAFRSYRERGTTRSLTPQSTLFAAPAPHGYLLLRVVSGCGDDGERYRAQLSRVDLTAHTVVPIAQSERSIAVLAARPDVTCYDDGARTYCLFAGEPQPVALPPALRIQLATAGPVCAA